MKRTAILLLALLMGASLAFSQVIAVQDDPIFVVSGGSFVKLTATICGPTAYTRDSTAIGNFFPIIYNGTTHPGLLGQYPDSIVIFSYATADTAHDVLMRFKAASRYGRTISSSTSVLVDSSRSTSAAVTFRRTTISAANYSPYDLYGVSCYTEVQTDAYNALNVAHASKVFVRFVRYFHK
jgi:hypothetical protein